MSLVLLVVFVALLILNVPVAFSLAIASLASVIYGGVPLTLVVQRMTNATDSFILLAIPFFILAGNLMARAGMSQALIDFADSLVGFIRGGLAQVNILTSMFFAGITGAAVADTSAVGSVLIPPMLRRGYDRDVTTAVTAASSTIGVIIPPSIPMVIFGVVTGVSVGRLFLGGLIPGVLVGVVLMAITYLIASRRRYETRPLPRLRTIATSLRRSILALLMPGIIVGGIMLGVFTPTEAAVIAVAYALLIGLFVTRTLRPKDLPAIALDTAKTSAVVMLMISAASLYGWILTRERVPVLVANAIGSLTSDPGLILLLMVGVYLIAGTFMDLGANIIILVPVLFPITGLLGIDPVHFGVITVMALSIGLVTPPVGACLFVACEIAKTPMLEASRMMLPYILGLLGLTILLIYVPQLVLWIPNALM
jgi:C4-dicarboxylate transporter, DctM subunit